MTISISSAPFFTESIVSRTFDSQVACPKGKPITVTTFISVSFRNCFANFTLQGLTQTPKKLYSQASLRSFSKSSRVASCFKSVCSIYLFNSIFIPFGRASSHLTTNLYYPFQEALWNKLLKLLTQCEKYSGYNPHNQTVVAKNSEREF